MVNPPITVKEFFIRLTVMVFERVAKNHEPLFVEFKDWAKKNGRSDDVFEDHNCCPDFGIAEDVKIIRDYVDENIWPIIQKGFDDMLCNDDNLIFGHMLEAPARLFFEVKEDLPYGVSDGLMESLKTEKIIVRVNGFHEQYPDLPWYEEIASVVQTALNDLMSRIEDERFNRTESFFDDLDF